MGASLASTGRSLVVEEAQIGRLPTRAELAEMTSTDGVEAATLHFYDTIVRSRRYGPFVKAVDNVGASQVAVRVDQNVKIIILPAFFYEQFPESGGGGDVVVAAATELGLEVEVIRTQSVGSVEENAKIVSDFLEAECVDKNSGHKPWVVSLSKGGAEFRRALTMISDATRARLAGWINICGLVNGCHFVDVLLERLSHRMLLRVLARAFAMDASSLAQLKSDHVWWSEKMVLPPQMEVVNVVCVPQRKHLKASLRGRYDRLVTLGPNDGMVLLSEAMVLPGEIYPIWGGDHFLEPDLARPVIDRLLRHLLVVP